MIVLYKCDSEVGENCIKVMHIVDGVPLEVIDEYVINIEQEMSDLRVAILKLLCLEKLCLEETM